jgi:hypothetical protein
VDGEDGAEAVVLPGEQALELEIGDLALERPDLAGQLAEAGDVAVGDLDQLQQVALLRGGPREGGDYALGGLEAGDDLAGFGGAVPEAGLPQPGLELRYLALAGRDLKDSPGAGRGFPRRARGAVSAPGPSP